MPARVSLKPLKMGQHYQIELYDCVTSTRHLGFDIRGPNSRFIGFQIAQRLFDRLRFLGDIKY